MRLLGPLLAVALLIGSPSSSATLGADVDEIKVSLDQVPTNYFGAAELDAEVLLRGPIPESSRLLWSLNAIDHRALERGEVRPAAGARNVRLRIRLPEVKEGVVYALLLRTALHATDDTKPVAVAERKIWIFAESPWPDKQELLKNRKLTLFDPTESTAKLLTAEKVPFDDVRNVAVLGELTEGLLLIGEGTDFREYPELAELLWQRAAAGVTVVCLAPTAGRLTLQPEQSRDIPSNFRLRRNEAIAELDPRLDVGFWDIDRPKSVGGLKLVGDSAGPLLETSDAASAWPWFEVHFGTDSGKFICCGFRVVEGWSKNPAPRYLFARLLTSDFTTPASQPEPEGTKKP